MAKKKKQKWVVYSTDPNFEYQHEEETTENVSSDKQNLRVLIDRKKRRGKEVTLVTGYKGSSEVLKELGKFLKTKCGVGGAVKDGEILIQGNHRDKIVKLLIEKGYRNTKKSGG